MIANACLVIARFFMVERMGTLVSASVLATPRANVRTLTDIKRQSSGAARVGHSSSNSSSNSSSTQARVIRRIQIYYNAYREIFICTSGSLGFQL